LLLLAIHQALNPMQEDQLSSTASDDIDELLRQMESSFSIRFGQFELQHVRTLGELCDIIERKIQLTDTQDCTSQQAFYKLRKALEISTGASEITPSSALATLLPSRRRKAIWRSVEHQLGFKLDIIGISSTVATALFFAFLTAFAAFFISAKVAELGLLVSTLAAIVATKTGNTIQVTTIRACVEKMTREHYSKSRRSSTTFNRKEIFNQVQAIFMDGLALPASALSQEATFI
jgi:hypothetical protein